MLKGLRKGKGKGGSSVYGTKPLTRATAGVPYAEQWPKDEGK